MFESSQSRPPLGENASPFIDEGDGLTSEKGRERECVRMLLSLVAHVVGYKMIVGAHNTVYVRRMWEVLPHSPCMVNGSATTLLMPRGMWGVLPCSPGVGIDGAHNTIG